MKKLLKVLAAVVVGIMMYLGIQFVLGFVYGFVATLFNVGAMANGTIWNVFVIISDIVAIVCGVKICIKMVNN